jgi:hypothetical protein
MSDGVGNPFYGVGTSVISDLPCAALQRAAISLGQGCARGCLGIRCGGAHRIAESHRPAWNDYLDMGINNGSVEGGALANAGGVERLGKEFQPPSVPNYAGYKTSVFLAGTIEMNKATRWQADVVKALEHLSVAVLNPRRDDWDSSWKQRASDPHFNAQVTWEMDGLRDVDVVALYFEAGTVSPICLLELGVLAASRPDSVIVCCPEGYWRVGNVEMVLERYGVCRVENLNDMVEEVEKRLRALIKERSAGSAAP